MKKDLCSEVRAASANRMHSAALLRNWSKLGKFAPTSIHMGTDRAFCPKNVCSIKLGQSLDFQGEITSVCGKLAVLQKSPLFRIDFGAGLPRALNNE